MRVLKDKIKTLLGREEIKKRIDSSEFYFEKGRQILKVFEQLSVTDEVKTYLINNELILTFYFIQFSLFQSSSPKSKTLIKYQKNNEIH